MDTARNPAHQNQSPQMPSAGWDAWREPPFPVPVRLEEFFTSRVRLDTVCPETALIYAALEDAFLCFQNQFKIESPHIQRTPGEAGRWFFSDDYHGLYSFVSICTVLGLGPKSIRKRLKRLNPIPR